MSGYCRIEQEWADREEMRRRRDEEYRSLVAQCERDRNHFSEIRKREAEAIRRKDEERRREIEESLRQSNTNKLIEAKMKLANTDWEIELENASKLDEKLEAARKKLHEIVDEKRKNGLRVHLFCVAQEIATEENLPIDDIVFQPIFSNREIVLSKKKKLEEEVDFYSKRI